jgi:hypothetical protein
VIYSAEYLDQEGQQAISRAQGFSEQAIKNFEAIEAAGSDKNSNEQKISRDK